MQSCQLRYHRTFLQPELTLLDQDPALRPFLQMEVVAAAVEEEDPPSVYFPQKEVVVVEVRAGQAERPMGLGVVSFQSCPCPLRVPNQLSGLWILFRFFIGKRAQSRGSRSDRKVDR